MGKAMDSSPTTMVGWFSSITRTAAWSVILETTALRHSSRSSLMMWRPWSARAVPTLSLRRVPCWADWESWPPQDGLGAQRGRALVLERLTVQNLCIRRRACTLDGGFVYIAWMRFV